MKIIVLGSTGMIGHVIYTYLKELNRYEVIGVSKSRSIFTDVKIDIELNLSKIKSLIKWHKPDVIINCIGLLIKEAETYPERAIFVNSYFPHYLASILKNTNTYLIHLSTNCVFEGIQPRYYEDSIKDGSSIYAKTKGLGEIVNSKDLTIRTTTIGPEVAEGGSGLLEWFKGQFCAISGYSNMLWNGISTDLLAKQIVLLINIKPRGLIHISNSRTISKFALLEILNKVFNKELTIKKDTKVNQTKILCPNSSYLIDERYTYQRIVEDMVKWIKKHNNIYKGKYGI